MAPLVKAEGRKPAKKANNHPVREAKEGTNKALNEFDKGLHQALHGANDGANKALKEVDKGVHQAVDDLRRPSK